MKQLFLLAAAVLMTAGASFAQTTSNSPEHPVYQGVGPVMAGSTTVSNLPSKARHFLEHHFKGEAVSQVMKEYDDNTYDVTMADGTDIEFNAKGEWTEVDAPDNSVIDQHVVKELLPSHARRELEKRGVVAKVESVKHGAAGYQVEITGAAADDYFFNNEGRLLSFAH